MEKVSHLAASFQPARYKLFLSLNSDEMKFSGSVRITGKQVVNSNMIKLHAKDLNITSAKRLVGGKSRDFKNFEIRNDDELWLMAGKQLTGKQVVDIEFDGKISQSMVGIYPSRSKSAKTEELILSTQFESHHAREAFPCIDEPTAKAVFELTLNTDKGKLALSNAPVKSQSTKDNRLTTVFAPTPKMSSYLLAFVVGKLNYLEAKTQSGVVVRTYALAEHVKHTKFALDTATKCLDFFGQYFGIDYPLPKCDLVALPDFAAGAMENWGLVTFREAGLIVDSKRTSLANKQWVALTVAHELAHQWFGNLVTMEWWTDLWLNESFATWMEYFVIDKLYPRWKLWQQFVSNETLPAMGLDSLMSSHPIQVDINDPDEIRSIFDAISYNKGASVIRMLYEYIGENNFAKGLHKYLKKHAYDNASSDDLWLAWEQTTDLPIREFMQAWTTQTGFPLLSAKIKPNGALELSQSRFVLNPAIRPKLKHQLWTIPINANTDSEIETLSETKAEISAQLTKNFKLNCGQSGFFLSSYPKKHLSKLVSSLKTKQFDEVDRLGLLHEAFMLAKAGYQKTPDSLEMAWTFTDENSPLVWQVLASELGSVRRIMDNDELSEKMKPYIAKLTKSQLKRLGLAPRPKDSHFDKLLRPIILSQAGFANNSKVLRWSRDSFKKLKSPTDLHPDIRSVVFSLTAKSGGEAEFKKLQSMYVGSNSAQEKASLSVGLTGFKQAKLIDQALIMIDDGSVRLQEVSNWLGLLFSNRHAKAQTWDWMTSHWQWLSDKFGTDVMTFSYFPKLAGRAFATKQMQEAYDKFFNKIEAAGIALPIAQGRESIVWQSAWKTRDEQLILDSFK